MNKCAATTKGGTPCKGVPIYGSQWFLLEPARSGLPRLCHLWMDAGYTGQEKGAGWVQRALGWTAEIVRHPPKLAPEEVMSSWVRVWNTQGIAIDLQKLMQEKGPGPFLPKRWIVERTFSWLG